ncbi:MAG: pilus assembly protein TadG-related protein [Acidimicrobiia bacterium]
MRPLGAFFDAVSGCRGRIHGERGAILVFTAFALVAFMGFAAVAVDLSALFATHRRVQTVADVGALAGAQFAGISPDPSVAKQAVIDEIKAITATNLGTVDWDTCVDTDMPPEFAPLAGETPCISFTSGLTSIRVRIPDQSLDTHFAAIMGVNTLTTIAVAVVEGWNQQNGDILPFGIPTADASSTLGCPSDHPNGLFPCDGPDSGNFNRLQMPQWGINPPPNKDCTHSNGMFEDNIANGIDHPLGVYDSTDNTVIDDNATCDAEDVNTSNPPGTVISETGVAQSTLAAGLITGNTGGNGFDGRLTDTTTASAEASVFGYTVDNTPLWHFLSNYPNGAKITTGVIPDSCQGNKYTGLTQTDWDEDIWLSQGLDPVTDDPDYDGNPAGQSHLEGAASFEHMARCLREYRLGTWNSALGAYDGNTGTVVLFDKDTEDTADPEIGVFDLQLSPRWGWSPVGDYLTGTSPFKIKQYVPIYINTLVAACNNNACNWVWHAGQTPSNGTPPSPKIASIISFQIPPAALPQAVFDYGPYSESETPYTLTE